MNNSNTTSSPLLGLSSSAATSTASTTLLASFRFLLRRDIISNAVLLKTLLSPSLTQNYSSDALSSFLEKLKQNHQMQDQEKELEFLREEFNGIVLDLIEALSQGFLHDDDSQRGEGQRNESQLVSAAAHDLKILAKLFEKFAKVATFWDSTEKCRWRGAGLQTPVPMTTSSLMSTTSNQTNDSDGTKQQQDQAPSIFMYTNSSNGVGTNKLMLGVTMAAELE